MADKKYRLSFEMTDGTKQSVEFAVPQGESVTPDYAAAEGEPGHILNRTHWVEKGERVEILPETAIEYNAGPDDGYLVSESGLVLEVGKTYIVNWNGTEYTCVGQDASAGSEFEDTVGLGNLSEFELEGNGEPFFLLAAGGFVVADTTTTTKDPATISIATETEIVHKLPGKFLPDGVPYMENGGMVEILPDTTIEYNEDEGHMAYIPSLVLEVGKTYIVKWNGTEYTCVGQDVSALTEMEGVVALGDLSELGLNGNGEPFALLLMAGSIGVETDTTDPITISIKTEGEIVHKLDPKYLPDNVPSIFNVDFDIDFSDSEMTATTTIPFSVIYAKASDPNIIVRGIGTSSLVEAAKMEFQLTECRMDSIVFVHTQFDSSKIEFYTFDVRPDDSVIVAYKRVM